MKTAPAAVWRVVTSAPDGRVVLAEVVDGDQINERLALRQLMSAIYPGWAVEAKPIT